jgi:hypothetical protein
MGGWLNSKQKIAHFTAINTVHGHMADAVGHCNAFGSKHWTRSRRGNLSQGFPGTFCLNRL